MYFNNKAKNTAEYLALSEKLDAYIGTIASTIEFVRALKRSRRRVTISFDEWNVWYHSMAQDREMLGGEKGWPQRRRCSRTSTISRMCSRSAASSTRSSAARTW